MKVILPYIFYLNQIICNESQMVFVLYLQILLLSATYHKKV